MTKKYEVFEVGDELVFTDSRDKAKEYARKKDVKSISYKYSSDDKDSLKGIAKEI